MGFLRRRRLRRATTLVVLAAFLDACTSLHKEPLRPERFAGPKVPDELRVTLGNGLQLKLEHPMLSGDSLIGTRSASLATADPAGQTAIDVGAARVDSAGRVAIPVSEVREIAIQQFDAGKTVLLAAGIGATIALVVAVASTDWGWKTGGGGGGNPPPVSSCPHVYSWDGARWQLSSSTFGGAFARALARTEIDNLDAVAPQDGRLKVRVANEMQETDYIDAVTVLAVEHDRGVTVAPDAAGVLHTLAGLAAPLAARDFRGHDALDRVRRADGWNWESVATGRDAASASDLRDGLEVTFLRPAGARQARLVLDGNNTPWAAFLMYEFVALHGRATSAWYDSLDAQPETTRRMLAHIAAESFLQVSVWVDGRWERQGSVWASGPEVSKRTVVPLDLARVGGATVRVRLDAPPAFWLIDRVAIEYSSDRPVTVHELPLLGARDGEGADLRGALAARDGAVSRLDPGGTAELVFGDVPVAPGSGRTYFVRSSGWYRIRVPEAGAPRVATLHRLLTEPGAVSRYAVERLNAALRIVERDAR